MKEPSPSDWRNEYLALYKKGTTPSMDEVLKTIPTELHPQWESYMRGKTCPYIQNELGVYPWDLPAFLKFV